jgi:hypothetical protein
MKKERLEFIFRSNEIAFNSLISNSLTSILESILHRQLRNQSILAINAIV